MTEYEKMISGQAFDGSNDDIVTIRNKTADLVHRFNSEGKRSDCSVLMAQILTLGEGSVINSPFHCEFGVHINIGRNTFINIGATLLDGSHITIGNNVLMGPNCQLYTASHSLDHLRRREWETFCNPIVIEDDVWLGGNCVINQGVTIGKGAVIAANSVVNKDVPPFSLMGGMPAKLIRTLSNTEE